MKSEGGLHSTWDPWGPELLKVKVKLGRLIQSGCDGLVIVPSGLRGLREEEGLSLGSIDYE